MFYYKLLFIFIHMLSITLCFGGTNQESDSTNPTYNLPGGVRAQNPDDPTYMELAEESLQKYLQDSGNSQPYKVIKIENVTTQVVAGTLTKMNFTVSPADSDSGDVYKCQSTIWKQPWRNFTNINITCAMDDKANESAKQIANSETVIDKNDPYYKELANQVLQRYLESNGDSRPHKVVYIINITEIDYEGIKTTRITFVVAPECKGQGRDLICFLNYKDNPSASDLTCIPNGVSYIH